MWVQAPILFLSVYDFMLFSMTFVSLMVTLFFYYVCPPSVFLFFSRIRRRRTPLARRATI